MKYKMKRMAAFLLAVMMLFVSTACGNGGTKKVEQDENVPTRIFTDSLGREVEVPVEITRVVPSGTLAQIFLYAVAPDSLIAISGAWSEDAKNYVDEKYLELPDVGQFFGTHDLNVEEIATLNPQIIIDVGEEKDSLMEDVEKITEQTGIPTVHITANIDSMDETFEMLGDLLGVEEHAAKISEYCKEHYERTMEIMEQVDADNARKSLLYCVGEAGLNVIGKNSYQSQIIDLISDNAAVIDSPSSKGSGNEIDVEQLLKWDPEVIVFAPQGFYDEAKGDIIWDSLKAIKNDTYYEAPFGPYNWMGFPPSSNRILGMVWLTQLLYPEYAQYDMEAEVKEYYDLFYHCELTTQQYEQLTEKSIMKMK